MDICEKCLQTIILNDIRCSVCHSCFHAKCINLSDTDVVYFNDPVHTWYCSSCMNNIFPYHHVTDDEITKDNLESETFETVDIPNICEILNNEVDTLDVNKYFD